MEFNMFAEIFGMNFLLVDYKTFPCEMLCHFHKIQFYSFVHHLSFVLLLLLHGHHYIS